MACLNVTNPFQHIHVEQYTRHDCTRSRLTLVLFSTVLFWGPPHSNQHSIVHVRHDWNWNASSSSRVIITVALYSRPSKYTQPGPVHQGFIQTPSVWGKIANIGGNLLAVWGLCPQRGPGTESLQVRGVIFGADATLTPQAESFSLHCISRLANF